MANGTAREALGNISTVRNTPSRYGTSVYSLPAGNTLEFVRVVPVQVSGGADNPSDEWFELPDGNFVNYKLNGALYYTILTQPTEPEPPPTGAKPVSMAINLATGSTVTTTYSDGTQKVETA